MTASNRNDSKLEESIEAIVGTIYSHFTDGEHKKDGLRRTLLAFAEAVAADAAAKASEVREKCNCDHMHDYCEEHNQCLFTCWKERQRHRGPEPKECFTCGCREVSHPKYNCKEFNSPALPDGVKERIELILMAEGEKMTHVRSLLEDLCRLCLSLRKP